MVIIGNTMKMHDKYKVPEPEVPFFHFANLGAKPAFFIFASTFMDVIWKLRNHRVGWFESTHMGKTNSVCPNVERCIVE